jgi:hypothetical protein
LAISVAFNASTANAETEVKFGIAGDTYFATDNDKGVQLNGRPLTNTNVFKDRFGTNNVLLHASGKGDGWRANAAIVTFGDFIQPQEANIGLNIIEGLWVTGGVYPLWDNNLTFNKWFTSNSLTDLRNMGNPYVGWGFEYVFNDDVKLGAGLMNSGAINLPMFSYDPWGGGRYGGAINFGNNRSKSVYAKLDWNNLYKDWGLVLSCITGNEAWYGNPHINITEIYASLGGTIIDNLEAQISGKFFIDDIKKFEFPDDDYPWYPISEPYSVNTLTFQALVRYHFDKKFSAGVRFSYLAEDEKGAIFNNYNVPNYPHYFYYYRPGKSFGTDFGVVCEYKPKPFMYIRLEGGMISLSNHADEEAIKIFSKGDYNSASRLSAAVSMGFRLGSLSGE